MAKQLGNNQWLGKVDGRKYYTMRGVDGTISSKINQGMSSRVKNDAAYANTRLNNTEFGAGGSYAGLLVRLISKRWRTILVSFTAGNVQKIVMKLVHEDTTSAWGQRHLVGTSWQPRLRGAMNAFAKNGFDDNFATGIAASYSEDDGVAITGTTTAETSAALAAKGATGVTYEFYKYKGQYPEYNEAAQKFGLPEGSVELLGSKDAAIGSVVSLNVTAESAVMEAEAADLMECVLVVALPYKQIASTKHVLQELCSFSLIPVTIA